MKHSFKINKLDNNSVQLVLKIKLTEKDQIKIFGNSDDQLCRVPKDLKIGYKKHGINWLLHLLRLYIFFGLFSKKQVMHKKKGKVSR